MAATTIPSPSVEQTLNTSQTQAVRQRYVALDGMRGFVMLVLVSGGFGLSALLNSPKYHAVASQFEHLPWDGFVFWELIMPSFMFMVGASLPFALASRREKGASFQQNFRYVGLRAFRLILLGQFLTTFHAGHYAYEPYETLTQLGISYVCAFLILQLPFRWQPVAAASFLCLNWGLYVLFPGSAGPFSSNDNIGVVIDRAVFGLNHAGSWATINFLGSSITVLFGSWTAILLMSQRKQREKLRILAVAAAACFSLTLAFRPFVPIIHKAWTLTFTWVHTGCVLCGVLIFFWLFDMKRYRKPAFPLVVVGMNSIFMYMLWQMLRGWMDHSLAAFTYGFRILGDVSPAIQACAVTLIMLYVCYWLYQRKIFFKV